MTENFPKRVLNRTLFLLIGAFVFALSGCSTIFQEPTVQAFSSLTPRPSETQPPTQTPSPTVSPTPTFPEPAQMGTALPVEPGVFTSEDAANLTLLAQYGKGIPLQTEISPDGKIVGIATTHGVYLYNAETLEKNMELEMGMIHFSLAFSPDSVYVASGTQNGKILIWQTNDGSLARTINLGILPVIRISFSEAGSLLAATTWDKQIYVINRDDGQVIYSFTANLNQIKVLKFSPDGKKLFAWSPKESVQVWNLENGRTLPEFYIGPDELGESPVNLVFSRDGTFMAVNYGLRIRTLNTQNGTTLRLFRDIDNTVHDVSLSADGTIMAGWEGDSIQLWRTDNGERTGTIDLPASDTAVKWFDFSSSNEKMLILDDALHAWQLGDPAVLEKSSQVEFFSKPGVLSGFPESNQELLTLSVNRTLHSIQLNNGTMTHLSYPQEGHPEILTLSPIKPLLAYTRSYTQVEIWQVSEESPLKTLEMPDVIITSLVFSSDGMQIACGTESGSIYFWGIEAGNLEHIINLPETPQSLLFSADGNGFFARSTNTIFQYNLENGNQERSFTGYGMAVSNDGTYLAVAADVNENPRIEIHLVEDGSLVSQIPRFSSSMAFSPDGSVLVNIWGDLTIWRTSDGALLKSLEIDAQGKAMFSPDGRLLVLNAWDGAVSIWGIP